MAKKSTFKSNWPKYLLQWGVLALLVFFLSGLASLVFTDMNAPDPEKYCPFGGRHLRDSGARPLNGVLASQLLAKLLDGPELLDDLGRAPSVLFSERFDCVQVGVTAAFLQLESHICIKIS